MTNGVLPVAQTLRLKSPPQASGRASVPEIDPAGIGSVLVLVGGGLGLLERRRKRA